MDLGKRQAVERLEPGGHGQLPWASPGPDEEDSPASEIGSGTLGPYFREIARFETLTSEEEVELGTVIEESSRAVWREALAIPLAARLVVRRWLELKRDNRRTAVLSAVPADRRPSDACARMDDALRRVAALLEWRDQLSQRGEKSSEKLARIDREMQQALLAADLSDSLLEEILRTLRERETQLSSGRDRRTGRAWEQEIGLSAAAFRRRMDRIHRAQSRLQEARDEMIRRNLKLVVKMARGFRGMGLSFADLVQEGTLGLFCAVKKFDPHRGLKFSTYGVWWIRQAMIRAIQNHSRTVRLPSHVHDRVIRMRRTRGRLASALGRSPETSELARELEIDERQVERLTQISERCTSLDAPSEQTGSASLGEFIEDPEAPDPVEGLHQAQIAKTLGSLLGSLSPREREILSCRFGFREERGMTLQEIADRLDLSRERIRQIQSAVLRALRVRTAGLEKVGSLLDGR